MIKQITIGGSIFALASILFYFIGLFFLYILGIEQKEGKEELIPILGFLFTIIIVGLAYLAMELGKFILENTKP